MQNTRLVLLLQTLSKKEIRDLRKFICSPFFNQRLDVVQLFEMFLENLSNQKNMLTKEAIFQKLYEEEKFDDHKVRMAMSFLFKLTERFLVFNATCRQEVYFQTQLAAIYRQRNLPKHFQRTLQAAQHIQAKQPFRNVEFYENEYEIELEAYRFFSAARRMSELNLQTVSNHLDTAYLAQKLRQVCLMISHQAVYKKEYHFGMLGEVIRYVEQNELLQVPAIAMYYHCYHALAQPQKGTHFQNFKNSIFQHSDFFPLEEIGDLFILAINFCIKRYNEGNAAYVKEEFDLYQEGLKKGFLLRNGRLSRFSYRNAVTVGIVLKEYEWVETFIHTYRDNLEPRYQESMFCYNLARLKYERKDYGTALQLLQKATYQDTLLEIAAKILILKIFYESDEFDALGSHLQALSIFLRRQKSMSYHQKNYQNTVRFTKKLIELNPFDKAAITLLKQEIKEMQPLPEKKWLLERMVVFG